MFRKNDDIEAGISQPLYPGMIESPELRWAFIRKIYSILSIQLLLTIAVAAVVVTCHPISLFLSTTTPGIVLYYVLILIPLIVLFALPYYHHQHPLNYVLLGIFTVSMAFMVGMSCAFTSGEIILEAVILTTAVVMGLTLYTFWAVRRGHDFNFLGPFLFCALIVFLVCSMIQIFFPLGKISTMIIGGVAALVFCGYIVYDTDNIIKRHTYDQYILASVSLYLDIINLFLQILNLLRAADG